MRSIDETYFENVEKMPIGYPSSNLDRKRFGALLTKGEVSDAAF
jgi:hypothetical protein